jgi:membrane associated rhomboid family serine protease
VTPSRPVALYVFVALNVAVFAAWQVLGPDSLMAEHFLVSPSHVFSGRVWTLLTSALSHASVEHMAFNLFALWVFGRNVEVVTGWLGMVHLYVAGGIVASIGHVAWGLATGDGTPALGASGSVMAVAVVYAVLFPWERLLLFFILPIPAFVAVGLYVGLDLFGLFDPTSSIAHAAHLGGALYGAIYGFVRGRPRLRRLLAHLEQARLRRDMARWR